MFRNSNNQVSGGGELHSLPAGFDVHGAAPHLNDFELKLQSEVNGVDLIFARTAAVLRRLTDGGIPDDYDKLSLETAASVLMAAAGSWELVASEGRPSVRARELSSLAIEYVADFVAGGVVDGDAQPDNLRHLAESLRSAALRPDPAVAKNMIPAFSRISRSEGALVWDHLPELSESQSVAVGGENWRIAPAGL